MNQLVPLWAWTLLGVVVAAAPVRAVAPAPSGVVALERHALKDDRGCFKGLGATYMTALWQARHDRAKLRDDLKLLSSHGFNYIRTLSMVGWYPAWADKEIAPVPFRNRAGQVIPAWPDYWQQLGDLIDIAYDEFGLRVQLTIFADAQLMPDKADRIHHLQGVLELVKGREHKVVLLEVANEAWQNGFPGKPGIGELRDFGKYLNQSTPVLIALSSPEDTSNTGIAELYQASAADIATVHFSRDLSTIERGWLPVRDAARVNGIPDIPPVSSNEPIGPGASVAAEDNPARLVAAAAYAWMSGLPMYVYHTDAGVFGQASFHNQPGLTSFQHVMSLLPGDVANWERCDQFDRSTPLTLFADGQPGKYLRDVPDATSGAVHSIGVRNGMQFYTLVIGVLSAGVELEAQQNVRLRVLDAVTGRTVFESSCNARERFSLPQGSGTYIIEGSGSVETEQKVRPRYMGDG